MSAAGRPMASDHAIVRPMSACEALDRGERARVRRHQAVRAADRPATSGSPSSSSGMRSRRASVNTIGASSTRPTLKKTGRPTTKATSATAQCTWRDAEQANHPLGDDLRPPDSASILPTIVPSPMTTAMNPSVFPTPSWNARDNRSERHAGDSAHEQRGQGEGDKRVEARPRDEGYQRHDGGGGPQQQAVVGGAHTVSARSRATMRQLPVARWSSMTIAAP